MADLFVITPPVVRAEGKDVPPEQIQAGFNSLARQTQIGLNSVASDPTGPASGDLGGMYPAPTVVAVHATGGTLDGVVIGGTTPAAGAFTTLTASTPVTVTSGGTGQNALNAHNVIIGEGSSAVGFAAPGTAGRMLLSTGTTTDPAFANNPVITGGTIDNAAIGQTTPAAGNFTTLASTGGAVNGTVGATTPNTGSFTTLAAGSTVSGAGFVARFSTPGPIGNTTPSTGAFTTLSATTPIAVSSGGTGLGTLTAHGVLLGEGTSNVAFATPSTAGQALISAGATADPVFGLPTGSLINIQVITGTQTYTPTTGTNSVIVECVAPGGGSGGNAATAAGQNAASGGGGSGAYAKVRFTTGFSGVTVTIGAVGAGGTAGANSGGTGGTTSFGALISCPGGVGGGGGAATAASPSAGGVGGVATAAPTISGGTTISSIAGQGGSAGQIFAIGADVVGGGGGSNPLGSGGAPSGSTTANAGSGNGSGASGMISVASSAATAGAAGSTAKVIIYEYA